MRSVLAELTETAASHTGIYKKVGVILTYTKHRHTIVRTSERMHMALVLRPALQLAVVHRSSELITTLPAETIQAKIIILACPSRCS